MNRFSQFESYPSPLVPTLQSDYQARRTRDLLPPQLGVGHQTLHIRTKPLCVGLDGNLRFLAMVSYSLQTTDTSFCFICIFNCCVLKAQLSTLNILTQHRTTWNYCACLATTMLHKRGQTGTASCNIQKCWTKNLIIFKLDSAPSNMLQHIATAWLNVCRHFVRTMLRYVALKCCVHLAGPE